MGDEESERELHSKDPSQSGIVKRASTRCTRLCSRTKFIGYSVLSHVLSGITYTLSRLNELPAPLRFSSSLLLTPSFSFFLYTLAMAEKLMAFH